MAPLQRGRRTGKTKTTPARRMPLWPSPMRPPGYLPRPQAPCLAADTGLVPRIERAPPAHVAYGWAPAKPAVTSIMVGASNREQLTQISAPPTASWTRMALDSIDPPEPTYPAWLTVWRLDRTVDSRRPSPDDCGRYH